MNGFPQDDEHSIHCGSPCEANLDYYYAHQFVQGEEHVFEVGNVEVTQVDLKHTPVLENTVTGTVYAQGGKLFAEFIIQDGKFGFKCPPKYDPFRPDECTINHQSGEMCLKWRQRSPKDVKVKVDYEYNAEIPKTVAIGSADRTMTREEVYDLINGERAYQDQLNPGVKSIEQELLLLEEYCLRARKIYSDTFGDLTEEPTRDFIRKIAGIAVRCMESHGAPARDLAKSLQQRR